MLSIGEFSKITGLTVKTLRFYHEQGLLAPSCVDEQTGYRYYAATKIDSARTIAELRRLEFSVAQIADMLQRFTDEEDLLDQLERHKLSIDAEAQRYRDIGRQLDQFIRQQREVRKSMNQATYELVEKQIASFVVAAIRMKGRYQDCGPVFGQIARKVGRHISGPPLMLCHDSEYREVDADFEVCMPIRKPLAIDGVQVRELRGGRFMTLIHQGPYETLSRSYEKMLKELAARGLRYAAPCREVYLKGPGMIFRGNPKKYLTELQFPLAE